VRRISADERSARRGHRDVTMFCDADARRVLFATPGKNAATFAALTADLEAHGGAASVITDVSLDSGLAYQAGARKHCPNAMVSLDPFHVIALANEAVDQVRRTINGGIGAGAAFRWPDRQSGGHESAGVAGGGTHP
jgi:transposase